MKLSLICALVLSLCILAGCAQNQTGGRNRTASTNPYDTRRMITGSNVPQQVDRPTYAPTSSLPPPVDSVANERGSLVPLEPTVGAGDQSLYRLKEPSTGAGPAGSNPDTSGR